ncbi:MAG: glycerophosphodiester phosphodiesterase [Candidatus Paceibacterota bacterium]|jgi:glycerophosphoryl diester phosphodiesterase
MNEINKEENTVFKISNEMKTIAHRGWSEGEGENTIEAFRKASEDARISGVEFDIWEMPDGKIYVSHDMPSGNSSQWLLLEDVLAFLARTRLELFIECKNSSVTIVSKISELLERFGLQSRSIIFAFLPIAKNFEWQDERKVCLGIITPYPWHLYSNIKKYKPDAIFFGWTNKKESKQFKSFWNIFSLPRLHKKYPNIKFIAGVATSEVDTKWLEKQTGLYGYTADKPFIWE